MENNTNPRVDTLYMGSDGIVYRISPQCIVIDQQAPVELSYAAFLRMSNKDSQVGIDTLLSPTAISGGSGYTSRNISVLQIPNVGMAWASRVRTTLPKHVAQKHHITDRRIGTDFLFFWPPGKALSAYLTVVEQTRVDNRTRFLSTCDPTPTSLFTDWNVVIPNVGIPVDPSTLTVNQRIFAASLKPMVHLASPRYTADSYCIHRSREYSFLYTNAPIQLKYSGLKRLRRGEDEFPGTPTHARKRAMDFFMDMDPKLNLTFTDNATTTRDEKETPVIMGFKELLHGVGVTSRSSESRPPTTAETETTWDSNVPEDVQCCIIEAVVHQALNTMDDVDAIKCIRNARQVCRSFLQKTDHSVHSVLVDAYCSAKSFCAPTASVQRLDGMLLKRSWWDNCRLPYAGLLTYQSDTPRTSVATLASIVANNKHKAYPLCSVIPTLDPLNSKRKATMQYLQQQVEDLATYNQSLHVTSSE